MVDIPDIAKTEAAIIQQTNAFRRAQGLAGLAPDPKLMQAARQFAVYLAKTGRLAHEADGRQPSQRARAAGYASCWISENLAYRRDSKGFTATALATSAMEGWKNSSAHRANLVARDMLHVGVGVARAPDEPTKYLAVQMFGNNTKGRLGCRSADANDKMPGRTDLATDTPSPHVPTALPRRGSRLPAIAHRGDAVWGVTIDARFRTVDGTLYTVSKGPDGAVGVDTGWIGAPDAR